MENDDLTCVENQHLEASKGGGLRGINIGGRISYCRGADRLVVGARKLAEV